MVRMIKYFKWFMVVKHLKISPNSKYDRRHPIGRSLWSSIYVKTFLNNDLISTDQVKVYAPISIFG